MGRTFVTPPGFDVMRRRRQGVKYTDELQLYIGHTTQNSVVDSGEQTIGEATPPRIVCNAGGVGGAGAPLEVASAWEYFNQVPWADTTRDKLDVVGRGDAVFACPIRIAGFPLLIADFNSIGGIGFDAGTFCGMGFGSPWTVLAGAPPVAEVDTAVTFSLRYDFSDTHWRLVVTNKWAAVGHRRFTKDLGTTAALNAAGKLISTAMGQGVGVHWEILYLPNQAVIALLDGIEIGRFTDADAGADTPIADIYSHKNSVGQDIKGAGIFASLGAGAGANSRVAVAFHEFYREINAHW